MQDKSIVKSSVKIVLCILLSLVFVQGVQAAETYVFVTKWGTERSGNGQFVHPYDVAVDSTGNVYVVDGGNNRASGGSKMTAIGDLILKEMKDQTLLMKRQI